MSSTRHWVDRATDEFLFGCVVFFFYFPFFPCLFVFLIIFFQTGIPFFSAFENIKEAKAPPKDLKVLNLYFDCNLYSQICEVL